MGAAHGPVLRRLEAATGVRGERQAGRSTTGSSAHTLAMLVATGAAAVLVYDWVGVTFLRRGWLNLDLLWSAALVLAGLFVLLVPAP